jgi:hypothetical protein
MSHRVIRGSGETITGALCARQGSSQVEVYANYVRPILWQMQVAQAVRVQRGSSLRRKLSLRGQDMDVYFQFIKIRYYTIRAQYEPLNRMRTH